MNFKILTCGSAALALTAVMSWAFVDSTSLVRGAIAHESVRAVTVVDQTKGNVLRAILPRFAG